MQLSYQYRYPAELIDVVHLTNGGRIVIRPVLPQDRELMVAFFHDLSADARCGRFMHPVKQMRASSRARTLALRQLTEQREKFSTTLVL